jgi:metal transporter CNNM
MTIDGLLASSFVPDYSVRPVTDTTFLKIPRSMYIAAKQATVLERTHAHTDERAQNEVGDKFEEQIDRVSMELELIMLTNPMCTN